MCKQVSRRSAGPVEQGSAKHGVTFFTDPGAECIIGGMAATGASGTRSHRSVSRRSNHPQW